jgi:hypothetical protein
MGGKASANRGAPAARGTAADAEAFKSRADSANAPANPVSGIRLDFEKRPGSAIRAR